MWPMPLFASLPGTSVLGDAGKFLAALAPVSAGALPAVTALLSAALVLGLTPAVQRRALAARLVDRPAHRRQHRGLVPRAGGVVVISAVFLAAAIGAIRAPADDREAVAAILISAAVVFLTGVWDDRTNLGPWAKLAGLILAAGMAAMGGIRLEGLGGPGDWLAVVVTIGWLTVSANAWNVIDGSDGLAAGLAVVAALALIFRAGQGLEGAVALLALPLATGLLAFLRFNAPPASIFLGDGGSLTIGFLLGCLTIQCVSNSPTVPGQPLTELFWASLVMALPLADLLLAVARRLIWRRPVMRGDREHLHHRLLDRGWTPRRLGTTMAVVAGLLAIPAVMPSGPEPEPRRALAVVCLTGGVLAVRPLLRSEWDEIKRRLLGSGRAERTVSGAAAGSKPGNVRMAAGLDACVPAQASCPSGRR